MADMICDGVNDLFSALMKIYFEKDEKKKVFIVLFDGVKPMFLCVLTLRMFII